VADWVVQLLFGSLYGGIVLIIALAGAIPYGIWQGIKALRRKLPGGTDGNS
jgi:hypothetical protein